MHILYGLAMHTVNLRIPLRYDKNIYAFLGDSYTWPSGQKTSSVLVRIEWFDTTLRPTPNITEFEGYLSLNPTEGYVNTPTYHKAEIAQACLLPAEFTPFLLENDITPSQAWPIIRAAARRTKTIGALTIVWDWL